MSDDFPNRQTIRLPGYDYGQNGYYFITICTQNMENMFGHIVGAIHESPDSLKKTPIHVFQRNYFEHIIRSEREYKQIVYYIGNNPQNWETDVNYV